MSDKRAELKQATNSASNSILARLGDNTLAVKSLHTHELFRGANTVRIEHNGDVYSLRLTRNNKLILTK